MRPAMGSLEMSAKGSLPAMRERRVPRACSSFGEWCDELRRTQRPGDAFSGEWLNVAGAIAKQEEPCVGVTLQAMVQRRCSLPRQLGQIEVRRATRCKESADGVVGANLVHQAWVDASGHCRAAVFDRCETNVAVESAYHGDGLRSDACGDGVEKGA